MSEFGESYDNEFNTELEKNMSLHKVAYKRESIYSDFLISKRDISRIFQDWQPPKKLVEVPQFVADYIELCIRAGSGLIWSIRPDRDANELCRLTYDWLFPNGYKLEGGIFPDPFEPDNLVRPDSDNQLKFARAWLDGYTVETEKLYLLKHIEISNRDTTINCYLTHTFTSPFIGHINFSKGYDMSDVKDCHFIQSEIDGMEIGSYEQIEVNP